jgi:hypothetical protein
MSETTSIFRIASPLNKGFAQKQTLLNLPPICQGAK